jgi:trigger factor
MRDQILHDVAHGLIPKAVDDALRERGVTPVDTPDIRDITVEEGQPLTFTATFETLPPVDPGEYRGLTLRRTPVAVTDDAVSEALERLRERSARSEPVEGRSIAHGDMVTVDLERRIVRPPRADATTPPAPETHTDVEIEIGAAANPPGFDEQLVGLDVGASREFTVTYPDDYEGTEFAGAEVWYSITIKGLRQRVLPALDDEFARDLGTFESLDALRERVRDDLRAQLERGADRQTRSELLQQLARRIPGEVPETLVSREVDRRAEHLVAQLLAQRVDPRTANIDWDEFREQQRAAATDTVRSTLVLDEIAKLEGIEVTEDEIDREIERQATRSERTVSAARAVLEREGGLASLAVGLRREKTIDFVLTHATIVTA